MIPPPIIIPGQNESLNDKNIIGGCSDYEHKLNSLSFFIKCENIVRDLEYYTQLSVITELINATIYKQIQKLKKRVLSLHPKYKEKVNQYLARIQELIHKFRDIEIDGSDYYFDHDISIIRYKTDISQSWVTICDMKELERENEGKR